MAEERWELTNEQWKKPNHYYQNASAGPRFDNNTDFAFFERFSVGQTNFFCPEKPLPYQLSANLEYAQPKDFL